MTLFEVQSQTLFPDYMTSGNGILILFKQLCFNLIKCFMVNVIKIFYDLENYNVNTLFLTTGSFQVILSTLKLILGMLFDVEKKQKCFFKREKLSRASIKEEGTTWDRFRLTRIFFKTLLRQEFAKKTYLNYSFRLIDNSSIIFNQFSNHKRTKNEFWKKLCQAKAVSCRSKFFKVGSNNGQFCMLEKLKPQDFESFL